MHHPEVTRNGSQSFHGVVRIAHYPTRQEKSLDVVATIELHCDLFQFADGERCPLDIIRAAVDAVGTVVHTIVGQHDLQQRDTPSIICKRVADAHTSYRRAHHPLLTFAHSAA